MIFSLFLSDQPFNLLALFVVCYVRKQLSKAFQVLPMDGVPHDGLHAPFDGENEVAHCILFDCCKPVQAHLGDPKKAAELQGAERSAAVCRPTARAGSEHAGLLQCETALSVPMVGASWPGHLQD